MEKYPVSLNIDYIEKSNRITVLFRLILALPILIILALLTSTSYKVGHIYSAGIIFLPTLLMIVFKRKYPKWWFDWNLALIKFSLSALHHIYCSCGTSIPQQMKNKQCIYKFIILILKKNLINGCPL